MAITSYDTLKESLDELLFRDDLDSELLIQLAESELQDDPRCKALSTVDTEITGSTVELPEDFLILQSWRIVDEGLGRALEVGSDTVASLYQESYLGVPEYVVLTTGLATFYPNPDSDYRSKLTYWRKILPLSEDRQTNWLLLSRPNIYLYGAAIHSAPQLRDDQRIQTWLGLYNSALDNMHRATKNAQWGGPIRRFVEAID